MQNLASIILDVSIVFLLFYCTYRGYRNGFLKMIVSFVGNLISLIIAYFASRVVATMISSAMRANIIRSVSTNMQTVLPEADIQDTISNFLTQIPDYFKNAISHYLGDPQQISSAIEGTTTELATTVTDMVILPVANALIQTILFFVLFAVLMFLVRRVINMCGIFRRVPLIGSVNAVLGGVLGCLQCIIVFVIITGVVSVLLAVTGGIPKVLDEQTISNTFLFQILYSLNPFVVQVSP